MELNEIMKHNIKKDIVIMRNDDALMRDMRELRGMMNIPLELMRYEENGEEYYNIEGYGGFLLKRFLRWNGVNWEKA